MGRHKAFESFIGNSAAMQVVYERLERIGASQARVLITGETGTGKELAARALAQLGPRSNQPFVALNVAALPRDLMESEIFGHVRGAFTGAHRDHAGLIGQARGGTLFLDEIGELDPALQAKLLRFLETGLFRKVGGLTDEIADTRIISATHRNLKNAVLAGSFREDLYWRLRVVELDLPPLRARGEDVVILARHFLDRFSALENKSFTGFSNEALDFLRRHDFPGNVRELENTIHQAVVLSQEGIITAKALGAERRRPDAGSNVVTLNGASPSPDEGGFRPREIVSPPPFAACPRPLWQVEQEAIDRALAWTNGNIPAAARLLEVNPSTLYRRKAQINQAPIKELEKL